MLQRADLRSGEKNLSRRSRSVAQLASEAQPVNVHKARSLAASSLQPQLDFIAIQNERGSGHRLCPLPLISP